MPKAIYLDACVILSYLEGTECRMTVLDSVFDDARTKSPTIDLFTSVLSLAEVAYVTDHAFPEAISIDDLKRIEGFWAERLLKTIEINERIARLGRQVLRDRRTTTPSDQELEVRGRSIDALHIGSALYLQCEEIWTYDPRMTKLSSLIDNCHICQPHTDRPRLPL
jgi:predicted nucleic acid-binding protein